MEEMIAGGAGWDGHKKSVEACVRRLEPGGRRHQETRHWGTMTRDLWALAEWMAAQGVTHVALESTGGLLETDLQHSGGAVQGVTGECAASEAGAGTQE